mmetsp:Transcript_76257/g.198713  ORF Transcript_76257/g.198713 Transcript_76257/m.198713 type:complete len:207 (-) Transcript_76257:539-1159(-)
MYSTQRATACTRAQRLRNSPMHSPYKCRATICRNCACGRPAGSKRHQSNYKQRPSVSAGSIAIIISEASEPRMQNQRMSNVRWGRNGCTALRHELLNVIHDGAANMASKPKIAKNAQEHTAVQIVAGSTSSIFLQSRRAQQTKVQGKQISQLRPLFGIVSKLSTKKSGAARAGQHTSQMEASRIESTTAKSTDNKQGMQVEPAHKH